MQKTFLTIITLLIAMSWHFAYATPSSDLAALLNGVKTMHSNFVQTIQDNHGKSIQKSYGQMDLSRPGKFRWEVKKPVPQVVIANGEKIWIYDPDLQQVTIKILQHGAGETPALLLSHVNDTLDNDFRVTQTNGNQAGLNWYALAPMKKDSMFKAIEMGFANGHIAQMKLQDHLGHTTLIQFNNPTINAGLSASLFTFKARSGVDVIDETRQRQRH